MKISKLELTKIRLDVEEDEQLDSEDTINEVAEDDDSEYMKTLDCPHCGTVWYNISDGEANLDDTCEHLRFVWEQSADGIEAYNGFSIERFADSAVTAYRKVYGNDSDSDYNTPVDLLSSIMFDEEVWALIKSPYVDELWDHTQEFMSCGPSSYTVLFGVKAVV